MMKSYAEIHPQKPTKRQKLCVYIYIYTYIWKIQVSLHKLSCLKADRLIFDWWKLPNGNDHRGMCRNQICPSRVLSLKLTASLHLNMDGWNTLSFPFGKRIRMEFPSNNVFYIGVFSFLILFLSSWWLNQLIWKICAVVKLAEHLPQTFGVKIPKTSLSCHRKKKTWKKRPNAHCLIHFDSCFFFRLTRPTL